MTTSNRSGKRNSKPSTGRRPLSPAKKQRSEEQYQERAEALQAELTRKVGELVASDQWTAFLRSCASFRHYSLNNTLLIHAQFPQATQVAGYATWEKLGRKVTDKCRIRIYGRPFRVIKETDAATGELTRRTVAARPPILCVWDISQTEPIPGAQQSTELVQRLNGEDPASIYDRTAAALEARGWTITREPIPGKANGYTTLTGDRRVVVDSSLSPAQAAKTALHELAHVVLHAEPFRAAAEAGAEIPQLHRGIKETEAESVAYVVAAMLGLDTSDYSIGYVAGWAKGNTELITATATRVHTAAADIAAALDIDGTGTRAPAEDTTAPLTQAHTARRAA